MLRTGRLYPIWLVDAASRVEELTMGYSATHQELFKGLPLAANSSAAAPIICAQNPPAAPIAAPMNPPAAAPMAAHPNLAQPPAAVLNPPAPPNDIALYDDNDDSDAIASQRGDASSKFAKRSVYLPSSFTNSSRNKKEHVIDALALESHFGPVQFFITATMNVKSPSFQKLLEFIDESGELQKELYLNRPDLVNRTFQFFFLAFANFFFFCTFFNLKCAQLVCLLNNSLNTSKTIKYLALMCITFTQLSSKNVVYHMFTLHSESAKRSQLKMLISSSQLNYQRNQSQNQLITKLNQMNCLMKKN